MKGKISHGGAGHPLQFKTIAVFGDVSALDAGGWELD